MDETDLIDLDNLRVEEFCAMVQVYEEHNANKKAGSKKCESCVWIHKKLDKLWRITAENAMVRELKGGKQMEENVEWKTLILKVLEDEEVEEKAPLKRRMDEEEEGNNNEEGTKIRRGLIELEEELEEEDEMEEEQEIEDPFQPSTSEVKPRRSKRI